VLPSPKASLAISPKPSASTAYNAKIQERLKHSAFADPNCNSWYKNEKGLITNNWADNVVAYQELTRKIDWEDWDVRGADGELLEQSGKTEWKRRVEETVVSDKFVLGGLILSAGVVILGALGRRGHTLLG